MLKQFLFISLTVGAILTSKAQLKNVADRYFNEYAYKKSAELYESIVKNGDSSITILERLGDSYFYNRDVTNATKWYGVLFDKYNPSEIDSTYYLKYAKALKSNGDIAKSDDWLKKYLIINPNDQTAKLMAEKIVLPKSKSAFVFEALSKIDINTQYSDFTGFIDAKNNFYWFSAKPSSKGSKLYKWTEEPYLDVYTGILESNSQIIHSKPLPGDVNTKLHEATLTITKDGKTMFFSRDNYIRGRGTKSNKDRTTLLKIYKATWNNGEWNNIEELPFTSDDYNTTHPALSPDGQWLYFASDMPGSINNSPDIYRIKVTDSLLDTPENLGPVINTRASESFPYIGHDNTLYFASDGHAGYGLKDLFKVEFENNNFKKVVNLGDKINSPFDDFGLMFKADNKTGFFSSNREKLNDDIYSFALTEVPPCYEHIAGNILNAEDNTPLHTATVNLVDHNTKQVIESIITKTDGKFAFNNLDCGKMYVLVAQKEDFMGNSKTVTLTFENNSVKTIDLHLKSLIKANEIVINPLYFDFDKYDIRPDAAYELENLVQVLNQHPKMVIKIETHTDSRGDDAYNLNLSDLRAKAVQNYIYSRGIAKERIESAIGYGETKPVNNCSNGVPCSEKEHQLNRRSVFTIVKN